jgi:hypothetical protein
MVDSSLGLTLYYFWDEYNIDLCGPYRFLPNLERDRLAYFQGFRPAPNEQAQHTGT